MREFEQELGSSGRVLLHYSGTESLARITLEGPELGQIEAMANKIEQVLLKEIG